MSWWKFFLPFVNGCFKGGTAAGGGNECEAGGVWLEGGLGASETDCGSGAGKVPCSGRALVQKPVKRQNGSGLRGVSGLWKCGRIGAGPGGKSVFVMIFVDSVVAL